jgi:hypothetical protein
MAVVDEDPERVEAHELGRHEGRRMRGAPEAHIYPAVGQKRELIRYAGLHLVDLQLGETFLDRTQNLWHGVIASLHDADLQRGGGIARLLCHRNRSLGRGQNLPGFSQERGAGRGQRDMMRAPVQQAHAKFAFQALDLLFLSERHREPELTELHATPPPPGPEFGMQRGHEYLPHRQRS